MTLNGILTIVGIALLIVIRLLFFFVPFTAKSGVMPKKWQLWMLGESRNNQPPHRDNIVM